MALLIYTIIEAPNHGWVATRTLAGFALAALAARAVHRLGAASTAPMLDVGLFRNLRFSAASAAVTITLLLAHGIHLPGHPVLPVPQGLRPVQHRRAAAAGRTLTGIASVLGTSLAVRSGTKLVVADRPRLARRGPRLDLDRSASTTYLTIAGRWS